MSHALFHRYALDRYSRRPTGRLHRVCPRWKLLATVLALLAIGCTPPGWLAVDPWGLLSAAHVAIAALLVVSIFVSGLPGTYVAARVGGFAVFIATVSLTIPLARGFGAGWELMASVIAKGTLSFTAILLLVNTTPFDRLLWAMRRWRLPRLLVAAIGAMHRYAFVLSDELQRMRRARRARSFGAQHRAAANLRSGATQVGMLVIRASDRAQRVHAAMLARGFHGEYVALDDLPRKAEGGKRKAEERRSVQQFTPSS